MNIIKYPSDEAVNEAVKADKKLLGAVSLDGVTAYVGAAETVGDHISLLEAFDEFSPAGFFRLSFDSLTAEWIFSCPRNYNGIFSEKERMDIYYRDGLRLIPEFLVMFGYFSKLKIKNAPPEIWEF
ncbi:MAG: hypothetical protein K6G33_07040 [Ruminococcus sp.]|uniref:hypothetical protein n=1 Tax=Ruminococcus sp. TaxID=41978 RepID=UPI0025F4E0C4|nr:hypothetical protein [Ruminococcus sp.]MCR5600476.1 hypothetical protein [Ruminococcus sp.]